MNSAKRIRRDSLLVYEDHGPNDRATWAHPQVAINAAQWISPEFDYYVSKWILELGLTGQVKLGQEKSTQELDNIWKQRYNDLLIEHDELYEENKKLTLSLSRMTERHRYVKLNLQGPCYYIYTVYDDRLQVHIKIKHGIAGIKDNNNIDGRLRSHRTEDPNMHLELIITSDLTTIKNLEKEIQNKHRHTLMASNHEVFTYNQDLAELIKSVKKVVDAICISADEYNVLEQDDLIEFNNDIKKSLNN